MKQLLFGLLISLLLASCLSSSKVTNGKSILSDLSSLNGTYTNIQGTSKQMYNDPLLSSLLGLAKSSDDSSHINGKVKIEAISKKHLKIDYLVNDSLVETKTIKGKVESNHFVMRRKVLPIIIPPIVFSYNEDKFAIGLTFENYLKITSGTYNWGFVIPFGGSGSENIKTFYYPNTSQESSFFTKAKKMAEELALNNPHTPIFYQENARSASVWMHKRKQLITHKISPEGVEEETLWGAEPLNLDVAYYLDDEVHDKIAEGATIGYIFNIDGDLRKGQRSVNLYKFMDEEQPKLWMKTLRNDLLFMQTAR